MRIEILQYLKDNDTGHLISLNDKLKELLGNQPVHNLNSLLRDMHTDGVAIINGNYGWFGGAQAGVPHTLDNIPIAGRILPKGKKELQENELKEAQILLAKSQLRNMEEINLMNMVLAQLNTKDVSVCHYLDELSTATDLDKNTIEVICQKIDKLKDCSYHPQCITITGQGKYKAEHGGYLDEKMKSSTVSININGDNPFVANQSSFLDKVTVKPIKQNIINRNPKPVRKLSWLEIAAYVAGIIGTIILLYQFFKSS